MENHDNPRAADVIRGRDSLLNWMVFYTLLPGAMLVYAGQEIGARKLPHLFEKDPVNWKDADYALMSFMQQVLGLAKEIKGSCDKFFIEELTEGVVKIIWLGDSTAYVALLNLANKYGEICIDGLGEGEVCLGDVSEEGAFRVERMPAILRLPKLKSAEE